MPNPRKPTALREFEGSPGHRTYEELNRFEPMPDTDPLVECPEWVELHGKELWDRLAPQFIKQGLLTVNDTDSFAVLCQEYHHYRVSETVSDRIKAFSNFEKLASKFGMNPSARSSIIALMPNKKSALESFLEEESKKDAVGS